MIQLHYGNWVNFFLDIAGSSITKRRARATAHYFHVQHRRFRESDRSVSDRKVLYGSIPQTTTKKKTMLVGGACATLREHENKLDLRKSELQRAAAAHITFTFMCTRLVLGRIYRKESSLLLSVIK